MNSWDAIVIGCGAMGSATTFHLSRRGVKVLTLERFRTNHTNGSSHGRTRLIRKAYFERPNPTYVKLTARSYELWDRLQKETGAELMAITGGLNMGGRESLAVSGTLASARENNIPHELLSAREVKDRFKVFTPTEEEFGVYEPGVGVLFPERCIQTHCDLAMKAGAEIHVDETALEWVERKGEILVRTNRGEYTADKLILTCGAWISTLLTELHLPLQCERQVPIWFEPTAQRELFAPSKMPAFVWQLPNHQFFYGVPDYGDGVKVARHHYGKIVTPNNVDRTVSPDDENPVRDFLRSHMPLANGRIVESTTCLYTNTPDQDFIIDFHPTNRNVIIVSPCSGHGFKFSSAIGDIVSSLVTEGRADIDLQNFSSKRFQDH